MSKLIDAVYGNLDKGFIVAKTIHISLKGKNIGTNTFIGMLLNQMVKDESITFPEAVNLLEKRKYEPTICYIDDIMEAGSATLFSPGLLMKFGAEIEAFRPENWTIVITKSIEVM